MAQKQKLENHPNQYNPEKAISTSSNIIKKQNQGDHPN